MYPHPPTKMYPLYYIIIYKFKNKKNYIITYIMGYKNVPPPYKGTNIKYIKRNKYET